MATDSSSLRIKQGLLLLAKRQKRPITTKGRAFLIGKWGKKLVIKTDHNLLATRMRLASKNITIFYLIVF